MERVEDFSDRRNKCWCVHCGRELAPIVANEDHAPSKNLLQKPHANNLPVIMVCKDCNSGFSKDEQYLCAFLCSVITGSSDPAAQVNASATRALTKSPKLRDRIERSRSTYKTFGGDVRTVWKPEVERIERVLLKNARGHAQFELGEPMMQAPAHVWFRPLEYFSAQERSAFETIRNSGALSAWPEVGSRMMTRLITGQDLSGSWVVVQDGVYRYAVSYDGGVLVRTVLSEYLATEISWLPQ